ncbi:hypothetical protein ACX0HA_08790 [Flavobacterium hauense]
MSLKDKINDFLKSKGMTQQDLANALDLNYQRMNKNIAAGKLTIEVVLGMAKLFPEIDMNTLTREESRQISLLNEPIAEYKTKSRAEVLVDEIKQRVFELDEIVSRK